MARTWTEKEMVALIDTMTTEQLARPLMRLWERQTPDEQNTLTTKYRNHVGFSAYDAEFAGSLVEWWNKKKFFSPKQEKSVRKLLKTYRRQLVEIANEMEERKERKAA